MTENDKHYFELAKHKTLELNDKWYIVNKDWYDQWVKLVNGNISINKLGKINNSRILDKNNELSEEFILTNHYELVPEEVWKYLVNKYGVDFHDDDIFQRSVIESHDNYIVEIQPLNLIISIYGKESKISTQFSRSKTLKEVYNLVEDKFGVNKPLRILQKMDNGNFDIVKLESDVTLGDAGFSNGEHIYIDTQDSDGEWIMRKARNRSANKGFLFSNNGKLSDGRTLGVCGLCNLGNTCFMNSALQCISNVPPLTYYFIKTNWRHDLNVTNPLGMHGRLAERYYQLLEQIWVKGATYTVPRDFKVEVAKFAPQFSGYAQHDSQELMMFLLDGLHEDLNRIQKKPYMECVDDDKMPILQKAEEAWKYHRMRNDSIIVENLHGLLKSTVVCPDCKYVSITFDPFVSLSLPLVVTYPQSFILKFYDSSKPLIHARVLLSKSDTIKDFIDRIKDMFPNVANNNLTVTEVQNSKITHIFMLNDAVTLLKEIDKLVVYDLPKMDENEEWIRLYMRQSGNNGSSGGVYFGFPTLISINKSDIDWYSLKTRVFQRFPFINKMLINTPAGSSNTLINNDHNSLSSNNKMMLSTASDTLLNPKLIINEYEKLSQYFSILLRNKQNKDYPLVLTPETPKKTLQTGIYEIIIEWNAEGKDKIYDNSFDVPRDHESINLKSSPLTIQSCVSEFIKKEKLGINDLWYCKECKQQKAATKKFDLWQLPKVLILHLKRFRSGYYRRDKIDTFVEYPITDLDLRRFVEEAHCDVNDTKFKSSYESYNLVAVSNHMGGLGAGHYTAFAHNFIDQNWYLFDDSHTSKIPAESVQSKSAYVLIYVSQSTLMETRSKLNQEMNGDYDNVRAMDY